MSEFKETYTADEYLNFSPVQAFLNVRAGVAHWGQDEYGKAKFEYNK